MLEMLSSRGHDLSKLMNEYPISSVRALAKCASINKAYDTINMSNIIAVGAVHAIEAGFSGKTPQALRKFQRSLQNGIKRLQSRGQGKQADAETLLSGFGGKVITEKADGRRKNRTGSSQ